MRYRLLCSKKVDNQGFGEVLIQFRQREGSKTVELRAKSRIKVKVEMIDNNMGVVCEYSKKECSKKEECATHNYNAVEFNQLMARINAEINKFGGLSEVPKGWLQTTIDKEKCPERVKNDQDKKADVYDLFVGFLKAKQFSESYYKGCLCLIRAMWRYECYMRAEKGKRYTINIHTIKRTDIEDFRDYLLNECSLFKEYPLIFAEAINNYPTQITGGRNRVLPKGGNAVYHLLKKYSNFFQWLRDTNQTKNNPFDGANIGSEKYGVPFYLTVDERNKIAAMSFDDKKLELTRDVMVFQSLCGARYSDLASFTSSNIEGDFLTYIPIKTKDEGERPVKANVKLIAQAKAIIEKYKGNDSGKLLPVQCEQLYNKYIKQVLTECGITRKVEVRNALTGSYEYKPLNEVGSSHMLRRTFIGNLYKNIPDPSLIGAMSGHTDGSKAFRRYREVERETIAKAIDLYMN